MNKKKATPTKQGRSRISPQQGPVSLKNAPQQDPVVDLNRHRFSRPNTGPSHQRTGNIIWLLVAHRSDAKLFKSAGRHADVRLVREFDFPDGRRQNREIDTDAKGSRYSGAAGRGNSRSGTGPSSQMKHGLDPHVEAAEHLSDLFAKDLAIILRDGRTHEEFDELILVAEAGFLGKIRSFLDKETGRRVIRTLNRNLTGLPMPALVEHLNELVLNRRQVA
jgi:protein required for attachment to host cells